jgi:signal transduction histidine kinase
LAATLYRILQEALTNICKHAQASAVTLTLHPSQRQGIAGLEVIIQDDGQGFLPGNNQTGFGLQGIQERAQAAGGTLEIRSHPNQGCTLKIWLPMGRRSP